MEAVILHAGLKTVAIPTTMWAQSGAKSSLLLNHIAYESTKFYVAFAKKSPLGKYMVSWEEIMIKYVYD